MVWIPTPSRELEHQKSYVCHGSRIGQKVSARIRVEEMSPTRSLFCATIAEGRGTAVLMRAILSIYWVQHSKFSKLLPLDVVLWLILHDIPSMNRHFHRKKEEEKKKAKTEMKKADCVLLFYLFNYGNRPWDVTTNWHKCSRTMLSVMAWYHRKENRTTTSS